MKEKSILLTFDLEEFDLPSKHGTKIAKRQVYDISRKGTKELSELLDEHKIKATFFVTALFAEKYPRLIRQIGKNHEIALHGYAHSDIYAKLSKQEILRRLKKAKDIVEKISHKKIMSFRAQILQKVDYVLLRKIGIRIDSSIIPTYIPLSFTYTIGRFENLFKPRKVFSQNGVIEVPLTVAPFIRLPLIWVTFRNMPLSYAKICTSLALINNNFVNLIFHPWEFVDITKFKLPFLKKNKTGEKLVKKLEAYIKWAKRKSYKFSTVHNFLKENGFVKNN